jgi:hypothetical protein
MSKIAIMLAAAVLVALGAILWTKSTVSATSPAIATTMSGYDTHMQTDTKNLPVSDIPGLI